MKDKKENNKGTLNRRDFLKALSAIGGAAVISSGCTPEPLDKLVSYAVPPDNVIPGIAYATFNIRFNNKHTSNSIKDKIEKVLKKVCNKTKSKYKIDYAVSGEAFLTKPNNTTFMIQKIIKEITKIKPKLSTTGGTSDARFIRKIAPCLEFGLVGKTMHKVDEAVSLTDLKKLSSIYLNILKHYFK